MEPYFETKGLSVGYRGKVLIHDISLSLEKGTILTLIGPNGAGKSTILKSVTRQLAAISGTVEIGRRDIRTWSGRDLASTVAVMLTDRVRPELMCCAEVVAMGRYPYTNHLGRLTARDREAVAQALELVHAQDLAQREFATLSDGQRQRILLARALCQEPQVLVLDEPTAYLDIRHKIELLDILRQMARQRQMTIVLSLHEIDLAMKVSDLLLCVKGDTVHAFGPPEELLGSREIERLYDMEQGAYNRLFGSVELARPEGAPEVFVVAGGGYGAAVYRRLQKQQIPFATGILFENDVDAQVAQALSRQVFLAPAFEEVPHHVEAAARAGLLECRRVLDAGTPLGTLNRCNGTLLELARSRGIPVERARPEKG